MLARLFPFFLMVLCCRAVSVPAAEPVSLGSLLEEMTDEMAVLRPAPAFTCRQFSSFDRAAKSPEENWFANADTAQFLRTEERDGHTEWVLMEAEGPGAIVRWWITAPHYRNRFFIYVDGAKTPTFSGSIGDLIGGSALCAAPLSQETSRGRNLYLPIPYEKSIKITCDGMEEQKNLYYLINYRTYEAGTSVESLTPERLEAAAERIAAANVELTGFGPRSEKWAKITAGGLKSQEFAFRLEPGQTQCVPGADSDWIEGAGCVRTLEVAFLESFLEGLKSLPEEERAQVLAQALRSVVLEITFDGQKTVSCPLGDFFGSGVGLHPFQTCRAHVSEAGSLATCWPMPFRKSAKVAFRNLGKKPLAMVCHLDWTPLGPELASLPDDEFLYFHADWHQERAIPTEGGKGTKDWNFVTIEGRGAYVGDVLSVRNPVSQWWGEGDEKIFVDGESFPSHFGTGTEDYYGYAWCCPERFDSPWRAQPWVEGPANFGNTTNLRFRSLDRIPFTKDFRFDLEVWHWASTKIDYAVAVFWYGTQKSRVTSDWNLPERLTEEASAPVSLKTEFSLELGPFRFAEAPRGNVSIQKMTSFPNGQWLNDEQLWWRDGKPGDELALSVTVPAEARTLTLGVTRACDYGTFEFFLDGQRLTPTTGGPIFDACNPVSGSGGVLHSTLSFPLPQPLPPTASGTRRLTIHLVGKSRQSIGTMFGLDFLKFE